MSKLTNVPEKVGNTEQLTNRLHRKFIITFKYKLHSGYKINDLEKCDLNEVQKFFDIASELTVQDMDKKYKRKTDKNDVYEGSQVQHYGFKEGFRIHGVYEDGSFVVIRIDLNHRTHEKH